MGQRIRFDSPELRAAALSTRIAGTELRKQIYARTRNTITPEWQSSIGERIGQVGGPTRIASLVLANTARVNVGTSGVKLTSATQKKALSGGLVTNENWSTVEFGTTNQNRRKVAGRRGQTKYNYTRRLATWAKPFRKGGWYVYPVGNEFARRYIALWIQTVARTLHDAVEGKL